MLVITRREAEEIVIGDPKDPIGVVRIASIKGIASAWPWNSRVTSPCIAAKWPKTSSTEAIDRNRATPTSPVGLAKSKDGTNPKKKDPRTSTQSEGP